MEDLILKIEQWAEDRNIINGCKPIDQAMKLFSEAGELSDNVGKGRDIKGDVGDVFVVLAIISKQLDKSLELLNIHKYSWAHGGNKELTLELISSLTEFAKWASLDYYHDGIVKRILNILSGIARNHKTTLEECVQVAYNDIKDRKGQMINGVFVKESDLV